MSCFIALWTQLTLVSFTLATSHVGSIFPLPCLCLETVCSSPATVLWTARFWTFVITCLTPQPRPCLPDAVDNPFTFLVHQLRVAP